MAREEPPSAVTTACPQCGEETLHTVLHGRASRPGGGFTFEGTVECVECSTVHHAVVREPAPTEVHVVVSHGGQSRSTRIAVDSEDEVSVDEAFIVDGTSCKLTGIQTKDERWVESAPVAQVKTLWMKQFEELAVGFAINLGHKTITKTLAAKPEHEFTIGEEHLFGRLRVTVHAIKTKERMLKRGSAAAEDIVRIFAKPTPLGGEKPRPDKRAREEMRQREGRQ